MPFPSSEKRFMPSLCRRINPINSSVSGKSSLLSSAYILQRQSLEGVFNQRRDLYIKGSYVFCSKFDQKGWQLTLILFGKRIF
jgi:hypothetical protein